MADLTIGGLTPTASVQLTDKVPKEPTAGPPAEYFLVSQLKTLLDTIYAPITGGAYVLKAGDTMTGLLTIAQATANTSNLILSGQSLTGANAQSLLSLAGTWNTSGSPTALDVLITNTASNAASLLLNLRTAAATVLSVRAVSDINGPAICLGGDLTTGWFRPGANQWHWGTGGASYLGLFSSVIRIGNSVPITFGTGNVSVGGDVGIARNAAAILEVNNATPGTFADLWVRILRTSPGFTVAALPVAGVAGRRTYVTDGLGAAWGVAIAGGGAQVVSVFDNGSAWIAG